MPHIAVNGSILLPPDLVWDDEYSWSPVGAQEDVSLSGATIVQRQARAKGRRITLRSGDDFACVRRSALDSLKALRDDADGPPFSLALADGRTFTVMFDMTAQAIEARGIQPGKQPHPNDLFQVTLRFMTL